METTSVSHSKMVYRDWLMVQKVRKPTFKAETDLEETASKRKAKAG